MKNLRLRANPKLEQEKLHPYFFLVIFTDLVCLPVTVLSRSVGTL